MRLRFASVAEASRSGVMSSRIQNDAAVRGDDQIVVVNPQIAHGSVRQIQLQRLPVVAVVERNPDARFPCRRTAGLCARDLRAPCRRADIGQAGGDQLSRSCRRRACDRCTGADRRCGSGSPRRTRSARRNAKREICVTLLHGVSSGGVMSFQFLPPSRVIQIRPSSVPAQSVFMFLNDGASA